MLFHAQTGETAAMSTILENITKPNDIKNIPPKQYEALAQEIREFLIESISQTGGHLASNLGVVELTMALHLALDLPEDKIVWDVGHQSYTHKILTGRKDAFGTLRKFEGLSGFPKREESDCDSFDTGHSSTALSAALGMARARDLKGEDHTIAAVIGDGAMTGGEAYEAINNVAHMRSNFMIILNDNNMSISENVGGLHKYLSEIRTSGGYRQIHDRLSDSLGESAPMVKRRISSAKKSIKKLVVPGNYFEDLGITYLGPIDGHNVSEMAHIFSVAKTMKKAVLIHICTKKGNGYPVAQKHPEKFHGTGAFDIATGLPLKKKIKSDYSDIFSTVMMKIAASDPNVVAITAAMADGVGLKRFRKNYPDRFFDVGIAEQHAVTFAAGMAAEGMKPVFAVYSTFLQRAFDQIVEDVCLQKLPVVFAIDRAGLVGADGETHQGIYDLSYLSLIPNLLVMAPKNKWELADMLKFAVSYKDGPIAIRYPRGTAYDGLDEFRAKIRPGKAEMIFKEDTIALAAVGSMVEEAVKVRNLLKADGINCTLVNVRFVSPMDEELLAELALGHRLLVTMEENVARGGFGEHVSAYLAGNGAACPVMNITVPDRFIQHGAPDQLKKMIGIDAQSIYEKIKDYLAEHAEETE